MLLLSILFIAFLVFLLFGILFESLKIHPLNALRYSLSVMFLAAGLYHFEMADKMVLMIPEFHSAKENIVYISGILIICGSIGLLIPPFIKSTGYLLILYLFMVIPVNIHAAFHGIGMGGAAQGPFYLLIEIPIILLLIIFVYISSGQSWFSMYGQVLFPMMFDRIMNDANKNRYREQLVLRLSGTVLEVGFGTGLNLPYYSRLVKKLFAVDPNPGMNVQAGRRIAKYQITVELKKARAEDIPLEDRTVDHVVSTWTLCSVSNPEQVLTEIKRVLKLGGKYHFIEHGLSPNPNVRKWQAYLNPLQDYIGVGCKLDSDIKSLIQKSGLRIVELKEFYMQGDPKTHGYTYMGIATK